MNGLKTAVLLGCLTALLLLIGAWLGGRVGLIIALLFAIIMNFGAYWFSDKIVLKMYRARPAGPNEAPQLYAVVQDLVARANIPMPKVYIIDDPTPNAFATGRNPDNAAVAATSGILQILSKEELTGVMAHELSHVRHRDTLIGAISATIAGAIAAFASMAQWGMILGGGRDEGADGPGIVATLLIAILAPIAAALIQMAISRAREYEADKGGAELAGNPIWLADALRKLESANRQQPLRAANEHPASAHLFIVNPLSGSNIAHLFSTHPPMAERIKRLEQMAATMQRH